MSSWGGRRVQRLASVVVNEYGSACWLCRREIDLSLPRRHPWGLSIDHVVPRSQGGTDDVENLRPAHRTCNLRRGVRPPSAVRPSRAAETGAGFFGRPPGSPAPRLPFSPEPHRKTPEEAR